MLRNLADAWSWIQKIFERLERLESGDMLENSSVTKGVMTFFGGKLRLLADAVLEVVGKITGSGIFDWTGQVFLRGPVEVTGPNAQIKIGNVILTPGEGGRVTVGVGAAQVVLEGSTGKIRAGSMTIDPTEGGGAIVFDNGAQLYSHPTGNQIEMFSGSTHVTVREHTVSVGTQERGFVLVDEGDAVMDPGIYVSGVPQGAGTSYLGLDSGGRLVKLSGSGGGDPGDPPAGNPDGYVWPVDPAVYGIYSTFTDHQNRTPPSQEPGVDVPCPVGTAVWSPGPGTVTAVQSSSAGATGRYVTFVTDAGDWFRFLHNSSIVVTVGQHLEQAELLAYSGGSGFGSDSYYGPHSHISFKQGYTGLFPGSDLDDFEAYMAAA